MRTTSSALCLSNSCAQIPSGARGTVFPEPAADTLEGEILVYLQFFGLRPDSEHEHAIFQIIRDVLFNLDYPARLAVEINEDENMPGRDSSQVRHIVVSEGLTCS